MIIQAQAWPPVGRPLESRTFSPWRSLVHAKAKPKAKATPQQPPPAAVSDGRPGSSSDQLREAPEIPSILWGERLRSGWGAGSRFERAGGFSSRPLCVRRGSGSNGQRLWGCGWSGAEWLWGPSQWFSLLLTGALHKEELARSTFASQNVQNTWCSEHFWKLRCRKSARRCGAKHISEVKMTKTLGFRTTFGSSDLEKVHGIVARSTFPSQNVQNAPRSDHFWKLRCRKSARRCGAKHISKSKCTKHTSSGPLLASWDVEKVHACCGAKQISNQNVKNTRGSDHFWRFGCRKSACRYGAKHISK